MKAYAGIGNDKETEFPVGKYLFHTVLLFANCAGIAGALAEALEFPWYQQPVSDASAGEGSLEGILFWGGLLHLSAAFMLLQRKTDNRKKIKRIVICIVAYALCGLFLRKVLLEGLAMVLKNAVDNLNQRYQFRIALASGMWLPDVVDWTEKGKMWCATLSTLYLFLPLVLSGAFLWRRFRGIWLMAGNILWFYIACVCDRFPGSFFLTVCVLGIVAALIQQNFDNGAETGLWAVICAVTVTGGVMAVSFRFLMPVLDVQYEAIREDREQFYRFVNGDWDSALKDVLSKIRFRTGVDVTGTLKRQNVFSDTSTPVYRVTTDKMPQGALYLKGFVGKDYDDKAWTAAKDRELTAYYRANGMELPEDYSDLVNISYEAGRALGKNAVSGYVSLEELGGKGSYSLYPSGALLTEEFKVHGDGSVARKGKQYGYSFYYLTGVRSGGALSGKWMQTESQYARYVYDNFLEYDEEALPRFTESLEQANIRTDSIYNCILDIMNFLQSQASYNLDAGSNPRGTDFVEYFLLDSHEGYCMHFASAGVLALRYCGVPARYVTGYVVSPSAFSADGKGNYTAEVTGKMAHAWAEIYLDQIGWVPVEMTPGTAALPGNSSREQMEYVAQLAGGMITKNEVDRWEQAGNSLSFGEDMSGEDSEVENMPEKDWLESGGTLEPGGRPEFAGGASGNLSESEKEGMNGQENTGNAQAEGEPMEGLPDKESWDVELLSMLLLRILCGCLIAGALPVLVVKCYQAKQCKKIRQFQDLGTGERIFWLYRNLRRTLRFVGCPGRLPVEDEAFWQRLQEICCQMSREEYEAFCLVLEKNSFAREEPSYEELMVVCGLHDRLVKGIYDKAPFYKKVLIGKYWDMCEEGA